MIDWNSNVNCLLNIFVIDLKTKYSWNKVEIKQNILYKLFIKTFNALSIDFYPE